MSRQAPPRATGFTLLEVLVALAIIAIVLLAALRAGAVVLDSSARARTAVLAQMCAENALVEQRLARRLPALGSTSSPCVEGGLALRVDTDVRSTPNPGFRRVDVRVLDPSGWSAWRVVAIVGNNP